MINDVIPKTVIDDLNEKAKKLIEIGWDQRESYYTVACRSNLIFVRYAKGDSRTIGTNDRTKYEVYRDSQGRLVNLFLTGDIGFNDQVV